MSGALELLPAGPASDRDVALALDSSVDPNNLSNEDAEAYIRGMAKISRAEAEYYNKKRDFIQETKDPNAVGYDFWVTKEALNRDLKEMEATVPQTMKDFNQKLAQATALQDPQQRQAALSALEQTFPEIVRLLTDIDTAEGQWERFSTGKNLRGFQ
jgi:t-SNARE complex subunit (syntaxin)